MRLEPVAGGSQGAGFELLYIYISAYLIGRLVHGGHAGAVVLAGEACDVHLERHRPHRRPEVEEAELADAQPVGEVARVGQRRREADDAQGARRVRRDEVGAGDDDLESGERAGITLREEFRVSMVRFLGLVT